MDKFFLSDMYLLKGATLGDIEAVEVVSEIRDYAPGEMIVAEGDKSDDIMIVMAGRAQVKTLDGDLIDELRKGAVLGEIAFVDGKGRTANVSALGEAKIFVIPADALRQLMKERPALEVIIYRNVALALCQRLREANSQIIGLLAPR